MRLEIESAIEQDAEENFTGIETMPAKHALATQGVDTGELLQHEDTEGVRAHAELSQEQPIGRVVALVPSSDTPGH